MKRFYKKNKNILQILFVLFIWRIYQFILQTVAFTYPIRTGYLGFIPEANFDGVYYINISEYWYRGLDQAFFPLYPILMKLVTFPTSIPPAASGVTVSIGMLLILLVSFSKLVKLDGYGKYAIWSCLFLLFFPSSFFLGAVYTESLFLALIVLSFYFARRGNMVTSAVFATLATGTRIIGIFLLPALLFEAYLQLKEGHKKVKFKSFIKKSWILLLTPLGLVSYMAFLWYKYADPLLFVHIQPAFGAGRSGGEIVLLPQVLYRYMKIIASVSYSNLTFIISVAELLMLIVSSILLYLSLKAGIRKSYILFSVFALFFPTLSGTLSSIPRYALACFVIFIFLGSIKNKYLKITLLLIGLILQSFAALLFFRGYFIS